MPHSTSRSLVPAFAPARDVSLAVKPASELALASPISIRIEPTFERLSYHLGIFVSFQLEFCNALIKEYRDQQSHEIFHRTFLKCRFAIHPFVFVPLLKEQIVNAKH